MLNEELLQELISYRPGHEVLSVYLDLEPSLATLGTYKLQLRQLLRPFASKMADDVEALQRFVEHEYDGAGRSLALFSCRPAGFFRSHSFAVPIPNQAHAMNHPYVKPLAQVLDSFGNFGVVLVDKQGARLFHFHLGALIEHAATMGEEVRHTKRGGGSQSPGRRGGTAGQTRYSEEVAERNLRQAAKFASRFFEEKGVRRVLIGGSESNLARFLPALPKRWQSLIVGTFPMEMTAGHAQVLGRAIQLAQQAEHDKQTRIVRTVITAAAKGREGVVRLDDTLGAVHTGQVQTLVISEGFRAPGYLCQSCNYVTTQVLPDCPFCGGRFQMIEDAVELAVRKVLEDGGEVEIVRHVSELETAGSIGGLLRY